MRKSFVLDLHGGWSKPQCTPKVEGSPTPDTGEGREVGHHFP
jgi:hypothetical protein